MNSSSFENIVVLSKGGKPIKFRCETKIERDSAQNITQISLFLRPVMHQNELSIDEMFKYFGIMFRHDTHSSQIFENFEAFVVFIDDNVQYSEKHQKVIGNFDTPTPVFELPLSTLSGKFLTFKMVFDTWTDPKYEDTQKMKEFYKCQIMSNADKTLLATKPSETPSVMPKKYIPPSVPTPVVPTTTVPATSATPAPAVPNVPLFNFTPGSIPCSTQVPRIGQTSNPAMRYRMQPRSTRTSNVPQINPIDALVFLAMRDKPTSLNISDLVGDDRISFDDLLDLMQNK